MAKAVVWLALGGMMLAGAARADEQFKLGHNQRIACSRGLSPGKLDTASCRSYAYVFDTKTSEYFRCTVSLEAIRKDKKILSVQTDGGCVKKPRVFDQDSRYSFEATETERPTPMRSSVRAAMPSGSATTPRARFVAVSPSTSGGGRKCRNAST